MKTTLDYALEYIRRGWSVIPLASRSKAPLPGFHLQPYLTGDRRIDEDMARTTFGHGLGEKGIGIITGRPSGIIVADVDPRNGGAWADPSYTPAASTGGGGWHYFYDYDSALGPPGMVNCGKSAVPGVDRRGDGGYVCAAPSIHPNGTPYAWARPFILTLAAPPDELLLSPATIPGDGPWVADTLANPEGVIPGTQEDTLTRLCWWAAGHLDEDVGLAVLSAWCDRLPLGNPHDPWTEEHIQSRLSRAFEKRDPSPGKAAGIIAGPSGVEGWRVVEGTGTRIAPRARPAPQFCADVDAAGPQAWLVQDFLAPGCLTEVIAKVKEGKSTFIGSLLHALFAGEKFLGRETQPVPVLWVSEQIGLSLKATLARARLEEASQLFVLTAGDLFGYSWEDSVKIILDEARTNQCRLVILDTFAQLAGIEDEDKASAARYLDPLMGAKGEGMAVLLARHARKSGGSFNDAGRGSTAMTGQADIVLRIEATLGLTSDYRCLEGGGRLGDAFTAHLEYEDGGYVIGRDPKELKQQGKLAPVVGALSDAGPAGLTFQELQDRTGIPRTTLQNHLKKLVAAETALTTQDSDGITYILAPPPQAGGIE